MRHTNALRCGLGLFLAAGAGLIGCGAPHEEAPPGGPPVVTVSVPVERQVTDYQDFPGRTDAIDSVQIRARVTGYLDKINFQEGAEVKEGEVLYEIDPRPYKAQVDQDKADLVNKQATVEQKKAVFRRTESLIRTRAASQEDYDIQKGDYDVARAAVGQAEARLRLSQLNLDWTKVQAPISGRLSRTLITRGNLVVADNTLLTTIVSLDPIYAYFDVDEPTLLRVKQLIREGKTRSARDLELDPALTAASTAALLVPAVSPGPLTAAAALYPDKHYLFVPIFLRTANDEDFKHEGYIDFVNNRVEGSTGTLQIRGRFLNPRPPVGDRLLTPGLFVKIRVPIGEPHRALLVSERALGTDQGLKFLFIVNDKNQVVRREVTVGQEHGGLRVIETGLNANERVIVSGLQRVQPGMTVTPRLVAMPVPPARARARAAMQPPPAPPAKQPKR
jgi:RND family efflux transporter MFP subunit